MKNRGKSLGMAILAVAFITACGGRVGLRSETPPPAPESVNYSHRKALVIGVDGMQYEKLQEAIAAGQAPNIARFNIAKTYTGGIAGSVTEQATYSGPGWTTVLTGAWVNRHKVTANDGKLRNQADSVFKLIKHADATRRTASIVSWNTINDNFARDIDLGYIDRAEKCNDIDQCVADKASDAVRFGDVDFVFAHFDEPDNTGHAVGFGPGYQAAIHGVDTQVGQLLAAVQQRQLAHSGEDWLVIVTPDHGRALPDGHRHGNQTLSEKTTFIAINKVANAQLSSPFSDPANMDFNGLYGNATQADIVPTVLTYFGIKADAANYRIDGVPLLGETGVRQLAAMVDNQARSVALHWRSTFAPSGKPLTVYRDGRQIAVLTDKENGYVDSALQDVRDGIVDLNYVVILNDVPVACQVRANFSTPMPLNPSRAE